MSWVCVTRYHWERVASVFYFLILYHLVDHRRPLFFSKKIHPKPALLSPVVGKNICLSWEGHTYRFYSLLFFFYIQVETHSYGLHIVVYIFDSLVD